MNSHECITAGSLAAAVSLGLSASPSRAGADGKAPDRRQPCLRRGTRGERLLPPAWRDGLAPGRRAGSRTARAMNRCGELPAVAPPSPGVAGAKRHDARLGDRPGSAPAPGSEGGCRRMLELAARFISVHRAACSGAASHEPPPSPETVPTGGESRTGAVHVQPTLAIVPSGTLGRAAPGRAWDDRSGHTAALRGRHGVSSRDRWVCTEGPIPQGPRRGGMTPSSRGCSCSMVGYPSTRPD